MENYIKAVHSNSTILRIPRVYSKCRKKGLMKKLRNNEVPEEDMNKVVQYVTLDEFVDQTLSILKESTGTYCYNVLHRNTIQEVKDLYA